MPTVEWNVEADISGLRKQLESIPGITAEQARAMASELNKGFKASERAAKQAGEASKKAMDAARESAAKAGSAVGDMGDKFGKAGSNSAKLSGALDMVSPALGNAARGLSDVADVGEVAAGSLAGLSGPVLGAVAVAAVAAAAAFAVMNADMERQAEAARVAKVANEFVTQQLQLTKQAALEAALASGKITQAAYDEAIARQKVASDLGNYLTKLDAEVTTAEKTEIRNRAIVESIKDYAFALNLLMPAVIIFNKITGANIPQLSELVEVTAKYVGFTGKLQEAQKNAAAATEQGTAVAEQRTAAEVAGVKAKNAAAASDKAAAASAKRKAEADKAAEKAIKDAEQAVQDAEKAYADWVEGQERATAAADALAKKLAGEHDQALAKYSDRIRGMFPEEALDKATELEAMIADLSLAITRAPTEELGQRYVAMKDQAVAALERLQAEQEKTFDLDAAAAFFESVDSYSQKLFSNISTVTDAYQKHLNGQVKAAIKERNALGEDATMQEREQADQRVKDAREAARKQFELTKALQMAQIAVNTAAAATQALASSPPPFNFIAAAAATAAGAVQMATVMATQPKFHKGGLVGQPDEQQAIVRNGEAVLNPMGRKALGDETIQAANAGALGHGSGAVQIVYKHKAFDYFVRDHLKTNATLPRALQAGRRLGHKGG